MATSRRRRPPAQPAWTPELASPTHPGRPTRPRPAMRLHLTAARLAWPPPPTAAPLTAAPPRTAPPRTAPPAITPPGASSCGRGPSVAGPAGPRWRRSTPPPARWPACSPPGTWPAGARLAEALHAAAARLSGAHLAALAAVRAAHAAGHPRRPPAGPGHTRAWLASTHRLTGTTAAGMGRDADWLAAHPATAAALTAGDITVAHVSALRQVSARTPPAAPRSPAPRTSSSRLARHADPPCSAAPLAAWADNIDPVPADDDADAAHARRRVFPHPCDAGTSPATSPAPFAPRLSAILTAPHGPRPHPEPGPGPGRPARRRPRGRPRPARDALLEGPRRRRSPSSHRRPCLRRRHRHPPWPPPLHPAPTPDCPASTGRADQPEPADPAAPEHPRRRLPGMRHSNRERHSACRDRRVDPGARAPSDSDPPGPSARPRHRPPAACRGRLADLRRHDHPPRARPRIPPLDLGRTTRTIPAHLRRASTPATAAASSPAATDPQLVRSPPHHPLGRRREHRPRQPRPHLLKTPPRTPPRTLAHQHRRRLPPPATSPPTDESPPRATTPDPPAAA